MKKKFLSLIAAGLMLGGASQIQAMMDPATILQVVAQCGITCAQHLTGENPEFNRRLKLLRKNECYTASIMRTVITRDLDPNILNEYRSIRVRPEQPEDNRRELVLTDSIMRLPAIPNGRPQRINTKIIRKQPFELVADNDTPDTYAARVENQAHMLLTDYLSEVTEAQGNQVEDNE